MLFRNLAATTAAITSWLGVGVAANHLAQERRTVPATHQVHERQDPHWSKRWEKRDRVSTRTLVPVRIGLVQRNLEEGHRLLTSV